MKNLAFAGLLCAALVLRMDGATILGDLAWQDDVDTLANKVDTMETWAFGNEITLQIEHSGATNATLTVLYTNDVMYSSVQDASNTLARAKAYADEKAADVSVALDEALETLSWGDTTSGGAPSPSDTLVIEKKSVAITGGGNFSYIESSTGGYWVLTASGSGWTMESLADAQNPDIPATATFKDADGNVVFTVTSTASREVFAIAGDDMNAPSCNSSGANDVITITFPVAVATHPTLLYVPNLDNYGNEDFREADAANWASYITSCVWSGQSGAWVATVTMNGKPRSGFFKGKILKEGTVYTSYTKPIGFTEYVIGGTNYVVSVEMVNGKKLMVLTEK